MMFDDNEVRSAQKKKRNILIKLFLGIICAKIKLVNYLIAEENIFIA